LMNSDPLRIFSTSSRVCGWTRDRERNNHGHGVLASPLIETQKRTPRPHRLRSTSALRHVRPGRATS
jgi:hypothetical protein